MYWLLLWSIKTERPNYLIFTHCRLKMVVDHEFYRIRWLIPLPHFFRVIVWRLIGWQVLPPICVPDSCIINIYEEGTKYLHTDYHIFLCPKTISSSYGREVAKDPANSPTAITFRFWSKNNVTLTKKWCNEEWANEIYGCLCMCGGTWSSLMMQLSAMLVGGNTCHSINLLIMTLKSEAEINHLIRKNSWWFPLPKKVGWSLYQQCIIWYYKYFSSVG